MYSRYELMTESKRAFDPEDGEAYPDPLSVNYAQTQFTSIPSYARVGQADLEKFWVWMKKNYNLQDHDDILLTMNNVPYIGMLRAGDEIYKISVNDMENCNVQTKKQY
jgi:hypothetical protein